jgi:hypothetical protein
MRNFPRFAGLLAGFVCVLLVAACGGDQGMKSEAKYPTGADRSSTDDIYAEAPSVFGPGGIGLFGRKEEKDETGIGVNSYLWRAALDTVNFMPLASADPFGGVILTDWYQPENEQGTRYKLNVLITDRALRASAVQVKAFKQKSTGKGWVDVETDTVMSRQIEDAILTRARQLKVAAAE